MTISLHTRPFVRKIHESGPLKMPKIQKLPSDTTDEVFEASFYFYKQERQWTRHINGALQGAFFSSISSVFWQKRIKFPLIVAGLFWSCFSLVHLKEFSNEEHKNFYARVGFKISSSIVES